MTAQELLGTLIRWTGLSIAVYGLVIFVAGIFSLAVIMVGAALLFSGIGGALFFFADEIVELAYWRRQLAERRNQESAPPA